MLQLSRAKPGNPASWLYDFHDTRFHTTPSIVQLRNLSDSNYGGLDEEVQL